MAGEETIIPTFPVTAWEVGPVPSYDIVLIRFRYIASPMQKLEEAQWDRRYVLSPAKVRDLIGELEKALRHLQGGQVSPDAKQ
jgi:biofilm regulator BssS